MYQKGNVAQNKLYIATKIRKSFFAVAEKAHNSDNVNSQGYWDYKPNIRIYAI